MYEVTYKNNGATPVKTWTITAETKEKLDWILNMIESDFWFELASVKEI